MKHLTATICLTIAVLFGSARVASALPPCPSDQNRYYNNCFGTFTASNGNKYVGEWRDDIKHGHGTWLGGKESQGNKYVGEYRNDKRHGQGTHTWADGNKTFGEWRDGEKVLRCNDPFAFMNMDGGDQNRCLEYRMQQLRKLSNSVGSRRGNSRRHDHDGDYAKKEDSIYSDFNRILRPSPNRRGIHSMGVDKEFDREMSGFRKLLGND